MKTFKIIAAVVLLCVVSTVSFIAGRNSMYDVNSKDYQAACMLSDICRIMLDNIGNEAKEIYWDYLDNIECDYKAIITKEEIHNNYSWCY